MRRYREDKTIDSAIRKALSGRLSLSSPNCPDDNAIAAYLEQKLSLAEKATLEEHASTCVQCQEILALSMKLHGARESDVVGVRPAGKILFRFSFTLSSLALLVVAVAAGILILQTRKSQKLTDTQKVAEVRAPEQESQPLAAGRIPSAAQSGHKEPVKSADLRKASAPAARDEEFRVREKARRDKDAHETDRPATPGKKSLETATNKATEGEDAVSLAQAQRGDSRKQAQAVAGQLAIRTQGATGEGLLQTQSTEPKPQLVTNAPAHVVVAEMTARNAQMTPQSALDAFSLQFADQTGASESRQAKGGEYRKIESASTSSKLQSVKRVGNKTFYQIVGYWIDWDCRVRSAAPIEEVSEGETRYLELITEFPGIEELRSSKLPVLLRRGDKNYVIRFRAP